MMVVSVSLDFFQVTQNSDYCLKSFIFGLCVYLIFFGLQLLGLSHDR